MRITIFGAAGELGSRILSEALERGHDVTAVVRNTDQFHKLPSGAVPVAGDASNSGEVAKLTMGQDLAISAIRPPTGQEQLLVPITKAILNGVAETGVRVLIAGGAASLHMPGQGALTVLTTPGFLPDSVVDIARACFEQHALCRAETIANWTYFSPPAMLHPGERRGGFQMGRDELLYDTEGNSAISMEDFAVVFLNEAEHPKHERTRLTAAY